MARITDDTYVSALRARSHSQHDLADRLRVEPRTIPELARRLDVSLSWLEIATGPDVLAGTPASWEACVICGIDPVTGARQKVSSTEVAA